VLAGCCAGALLCGIASGIPAQAEDEDRAQSTFTRPPAAVAVRRDRTPSAQAEALEWEQRLRPPERFGPPPLRESDAALLAAARDSRWAEVLQRLKSGKANANARDVSGGTALVLAARAGQDDLVREMLKRGAEIDRIGEDGFTSLGAAAFAGRRSTVRLLVLAGAEVERWGATGQSALHLACLAGQMDVLEELLRLKVDIELLNRQRESALDVAAGAGQQEAMERLIAAGADAQRSGMR
jgi:ankyrin repeat protein